MLEKIILHNFCGFRDFTVNVDEFTLLIGPNNGGKTTILRAVKFCLDACHRVFLPNGQPILKRFKQDRPIDDLQHVANAGGITDLDSLYFGRDRMEQAIVSLLFGKETTLLLHAECEVNTNNVHTSIEFNGVAHRDLDDNAVREVLNRLASLNAEFVPPPATITPVESVMTWAEVQKQVALGKFAETWRNRLHWMNEGEEAEAFQRVVNRVRSYLGDVEIRPPRRSKSQPQVEIIYIENGVEHEIAAAGGGVRTILTLAAAVELSDSPILLFDEPDSHLHSSIQRQVASFLQDSATLDKQVLVTSHAPDFIEETAVDSVVWIDRASSEGQRCDEIGRALIDLGAVSHTQALASIGADSIVYVEGKPDRRSLNAVLESCGKAHLLERIRLETLKGFGDADKIPGVLKLIRKLRNLQLSMAVILDADYTNPRPNGTAEVIEGVLYIRLPCKELENLLLSPECIYMAAQKAADRRQQFVDKEVAVPDKDQIHERIITISHADDLRDIVKSQWMCSWAKDGSRNLNEAGQLKQAEEEFLGRWEDSDWRTQCCPGKEILKRLRKWLQDEYKLSMPTALMFECYEPSEELRSLIDALEQHIA